MELNISMSAKPRLQGQQGHPRHTQSDWSHCRLPEMTFEILCLRSPAFDVRCLCSSELASSEIPWARSGSCRIKEKGKTDGKASSPVVQSTYKGPGIGLPQKNVV